MEIAAEAVREGVIFDQGLHLGNFSRTAASPVQQPAGDARNRKWKTKALAYITQPLGRVHGSPIQLWDNTGGKPRAGAAG